MQLSLIINEKCSFTGKKEKYLIGLDDGTGAKVFLGRECFDIGLKMLNAIEPQEQTMQIPKGPIYRQDTSNENSLENYTQEEPIAQVRSTPIQRPQPKKPVKANFDMHKAEIFLKELERQRKSYAEEHEGKDGGLSGTVIKESIRAVAHNVDKDTMFVVLKRILKMDKDRFEIDYLQALRPEASYGDE
jgi:hypothetical protein